MLYSKNEPARRTNGQSIQVPRVQARFLLKPGGQITARFGRRLLRDILADFLLFLAAVNAEDHFESLEFDEAMPIDFGVRTTGGRIKGGKR